MLRDAVFGYGLVSGFELSREKGICPLIPNLRWQVKLNS